LRLENDEENDEEEFEEATVVLEGTNEYVPRTETSRDTGGLGAS
jgi:hypothetical protein